MTKRLLTFVLMASALFFFNCSSGNNKEKIPLVVGEWEGGINKEKLPFSDNLLSFIDFPNTTINADVRKDSTYSLLAICSETGDTILKHNGIWELSNQEDPIYLKGTSCSSYNEESETWNSINCGDQIAIPVDINMNEWVITMDNLIFIGPALGIDLTNWTEILVDASITLLKMN